jgi:hypothetical protein
MHQLEMDFLSSLMNIAGIADNNFPLKRGVLQEDSKLASGSLQASFPTSYKLPFLPATSFLSYQHTVVPLFFTE